LIYFRVKKPFKKEKTQKFSGVLLRTSEKGAMALQSQRCHAPIFLNRRELLLNVNALSCGLLS
jgi:hypothetical protein